MKIRSIVIDSLGGIRGRRYRIDGSVTVFHGPNESGKTTIMEGIRTALSPTNKRILYPERKKTDAVCISYEEDGSEFEVGLEGKGSAGRMPACMEGLDPELYRKVFAMDATDLNDDKSVTTGEVSSKFLAVPGGDNVPAAMGMLDDIFSDKVGKKSNSQSDFNKNVGKISALDESIATAVSHENEYGAISAELDGKRTELEQLRKDSQDIEEKRRVWNLYQSNRGNFERMDALRRDLSGMEPFTRVSDEDEVKRKELEEKSRRAEEFMKATADKSSSLYPRGVDRTVAAGKEKEIESAIAGYDGYLANKNKVPAQKSGGKRPNPLMIIGALLIAAGAIGCIFTIYAAVIAVAGAAAIAFGFLRKEEVKAPVEDMASKRYEDSVHGIVVSLGCTPGSIGQDIDLLRQVAYAIKMESGMRAKESDARAEKSDAALELERFYSRFAGKEGYETCLVKTRRSQSLAKEIDTISESLRSAGLDPSKPVCPVSEPPAQDGRISELSADIGRLESEVSRILRSGTATSLRRDRELLMDEQNELIRKGAVALLAKRMIDDACTEILSETHSDVIAIAERYLSEMTGGKYTFAYDVRDQDPLCIRDGEGTRKSLKQCSSGLRAQVLLSMKLAVACDLGKSQVPVILDDVLLVFDSERKAGAVRALKKASDGMQVIMFTCDDQTAEFCRAEGIQVQTV